VITIPRRKQKIKYSRKFACKHLDPIGDVSNSLQPLCYCAERDLILGRRAYVCQVCSLYSQINRKTSDVYEDSRKLAERKVKEKKIELDEFELEEIKGEEEFELTIDEFEEEEDLEAPMKFEKRKAGKSELEDAESYRDMECPFCGEVFDDLVTHIPTCEFAPEDASLDDVLPRKAKKKKKKARVGAKDEPDSEDSDDKGKKKCPYCGKEFARLGRHLSSCPKKPSEDEDEEDQEDDEELDEDEEDEDDEDEDFDLDMDD
jgi:hypothetical protein